MLLHISSLLALAELNQFRRSLFNPFGMSRTFLPPGPLLTFSLLIGGPILAIGAMRIWKRCSLDVLVGRVRIKVPMLLLLVFAFCLTGQMLCAVIDGLSRPSNADEFSYLLAADTFAHGKLTNPTPDLWPYLESYHILVRPTYMSMYAPAYGLLLAIGQFILRIPLAGVALGAATMCAALCWALLVIVPRRWTILATLFVMMRLCWLVQWGSSIFWGTAVLPMLGSALLIGAGIRAIRNPTCKLGALYGLGLLILASTRPFEGILFALPLSLIFAIRFLKSRTGGKPGFVALLLTVSFAGACWLTYYNYRVTGRTGTLTQQVQRAQYATVPSLVFQKFNHPSAQKSTQKSIYDFEMSEWEARRGFFGFIGSYRRYFEGLVPLVGVPVLFFFPGLFLIWKSERLRMYWPVLAFFLAGLSLETFLDPGFNVRFLAPAIPLLLILTVEMARYTVAFAVPRKIGIWLVNSALLGSLLTIIVGVVYFRVGGPHDRNRCDFFAVNREMVTKALDAVPGDHLVLVHYSDPGTPYMRQEWVYNSDDIDSQRIVWAHELEPEVTDAPLICHFSTRHIWLFSPYPAGFPDPGVIIKYSSSEEALSHLMPVSAHGVCAALNSQVILSK